MTTHFDWLAPSLLWDWTDALGQRSTGRMFRPAILEFTSDSFMEEFYASVSASSFTALKSALVADGSKLFQPAHGRFYLVCASLCCRLAGFPDRTVRRQEDESVFFVLRKVVGGNEYAWAGDEGARSWHQLTPAELPVVPKEERLPLLPVTDGGGRVLLFGYIPVASGDTYTAPQVPVSRETDTGIRIERLTGQFIDPYIKNFGQNAPQPVLDEIALPLSVYMLLELWEYFEASLPTVAAALEGKATATDADKDLIGFLEKLLFDDKYSFATALRVVAKHRERLDNLADGAELPDELKPYDLRDLSLEDQLDKFTTAVEKAFPQNPQMSEVELPKIAADGGEEYLLRCVYERPRCFRRKQWISQPSAAFKLAPFFDVDAPARPIRIGLPTEVSLASLRKLKKSVGFVMSNALRKKLSAVTGNESDLLDGDTVEVKEIDALGRICSFSIPIITLCAFILLMIIAVLLHLVFWWLPFLRVCFPIKSSSS